MNNTPIRGAVIGYGGAFNMGRLHLNWMKEAGITPTAACDLDPERVRAAAEDFPGLRTYTDYHQLLADPEVDLVVVILPHHLHASVCRDVLQAGKHAVVEKPFTLTVAEADACIEAARASDVTLSVFHNRRFDADHLAMKEILERGDIGEVFHLEIGGGGYQKPDSWWRSNKAISGGNLYDWGVHFIDWVLRLIPDPIENVTGFYHKRVWNEVSNEDHTQAVIRFTTGKYADVQTTCIAAASRPHLRILGTKGAILQEHQWNGKFLVRRVTDGNVEEDEVLFNEMGYPDAGQAWYNNLADHLRGKAPLAVTAESARRNIAVIEAAEKSSHTHQAEPVAHENG